MDVFHLFNTRCMSREPHLELRLGLRTRAKPVKVMRRKIAETFPPPRREGNEEPMGDVGEYKSKFYVIVEESIEKWQDISRK